MKTIISLLFFVALSSCQVPQKSTSVDNSTDQITEISTPKGGFPPVMLKKITTYSGFSAPTGITLDDEENIYVTNWSSGSVSKISAGKQSDFATTLGSPSGIVYHDNHLYVSDYANDLIYQLTLDGQKRIFAQGLHTPAGLAINQDGDLLVANRASNEIVKINQKGEQKVVANDLETPVAVLAVENNILYISNYAGGIIRVTEQNEDFPRDMKRPGVSIIRDDHQQIF